MIPREESSDKTDTMGKNEFAGTTGTKEKTSLFFHALALNRREREFPL